MASRGGRTEANNNEVLSSTSSNAASPDIKDFLVIKSTAKQLSEGVQRPVDTAYIEDENGQLKLKAVFDVEHFKPNEIDIKVNNGQLVLTAQSLDDRQEAVYRKTMTRKIDLPDNVDAKAMLCSISADHRLTVSMPFYLAPSQHQPTGASTVPIITENGRRLIRLQLLIGPDFAMDDVKVNAEGSALFVTAFYEAEVGSKGYQVTRRELKKEFRLPEHIEVEDVRYALSREGVLLVEIFLKDIGQQYRCSISAEDIKQTKK